MSIYDQLNLNLATPRTLPDSQPLKPVLNFTQYMHNNSRLLPVILAQPVQHNLTLPTFLDRPSRVQYPDLENKLLPQQIASRAQTNQQPVPPSTSPFISTENFSSSQLANFQPTLLRPADLKYQIPSPYNQYPLQQRSTSDYPTSVPRLQTGNQITPRLDKPTTFDNPNYKPLTTPFIIASTLEKPLSQPSKIPNAQPLLDQIKKGQPSSLKSPLSPRLIETKQYQLKSPLNTSKSAVPEIASGQIKQLIIGKGEQPSQKLWDFEAQIQENFNRLRRRLDLQGPETLKSKIP